MDLLLQSQEQKDGLRTLPRRVSLLHAHRERIVVLLARESILAGAEGVIAALGVQWETREVRRIHTLLLGPFRAAVLASVAADLATRGFAAIWSASTHAERIRWHAVALLERQVIANALEVKEAFRRQLRIAAGGALVPWTRRFLIDGVQERLVARQAHLDALLAATSVTVLAFVAQRRAKHNGSSTRTFFVRANDVDFLELHVLVATMVVLVVVVADSFPALVLVVVARTSRIHAVESHGAERQETKSGDQQDLHCGGGGERR